MYSDMEPPAQKLVHCLQTKHTLTMCEFQALLPSVVFRVEKEISADNGDTHSHHHHDQKHQEHEPKHIVDLILPKRCEDKIAVKTITNILLCAVQSSMH